MTWDLSVFPAFAGSLASLLAVVLLVEAVIAWARGGARESE